MSNVNDDPGDTTTTSKYHMFVKHIKEGKELYLTFPYKNNFISINAPLMTSSAAFKFGVRGSTKSDTWSFLSPSTSTDGGSYMQHEHKLLVVRTKKINIQEN